MSSNTFTFATGVRGPAELARGVLRRFWDDVLPVDPEQIAEKMGVRLEWHTCFDDEQFPYSGYFEKKNGVPVIHVNSDEPLVRSRFTIAHELGHFALGHDEAPRDFPQNFGTAVPSTIERLANQFAAELLMPADAVKKLVESGHYATVKDLAKAFQVSGVAMSYRMTNLRIRGF